MRPGIPLLWLLLGSIAFGSERGAASAPMPLDDPSFTAVGNAESIPDGVVASLVEDQAGMIWIGTPAGLIRYDGYRFRFHVHDDDDPHSIGGNFVRSLLVARDGRIWVGTEADGLSTYDPKTEQFTNFRHDPEQPSSLALGAVTALAEASDGAIWVGKRGGGLSRIDPRSMTITQHLQGIAPNGPGDDRAQALLVDRDGDLWVGTWDGLSRLRRGASQFEAIASDRGQADSLAGKTIWCLFQAQDGRLWVGTQQGDLRIVDPRSGLAQSVTQADDLERSATIYGAAQPVREEIWIARTTGIDVRAAADGRLLKRLRHDPARATSLASNEVRALLIDRAGLLWVGGYGGGLQRADPNHRSLRVRRHDPGFGGVFIDPNVRSLLELRDGRILAGTQEHGVAIFDREMRLIGGLIHTEDERAGLKGGRVGGLAETSDGTLWIGTDNGLFRVDRTHQRFDRFDAGRGRTRMLFADRHDALWIATEDGLFRYRHALGRTERIRASNGEVLNGDVNAFAQSKDGRLFVGSENGLFLADSNSDRLQALPIAMGQQLAHSTVIGLLVDRQQRLWIDTPEGLHLLQALADGQFGFERVSEQLGIAGRPFGANLLEDGAGRIWTHEFVYDPGSRQINELTRADGVDFGTGWFRAYTKTRDGRLLFGGSKGLLVVDPAQFKPWSYQPPVVATELRIDTRLVPVGEHQRGLILPPTARGFSIEFAALDLSAPNRNRYRYQLVGFDPDWVDSDASFRVASYSNLWPGDYRMRVRGSNRSGAFSTHELDLPVRVLPQFWQTWWFAGLAVLMLLGLFTLGTRLRTAFILRKADELKALVEGRTAELRAAKERAESALGELQGAQRQLVEAEKMASLGGLVAGIAHEINTPIGIAVTAATHLQEASRILVRRMDAKELKASELAQFKDTVNEAMRLILGSLERALTLIGSFKKVAVDQSSEQRRRFELRGFLDDVRIALQPSFKQTRHQLVLDCPEGIEVDTYPGALFQIFTNLINNAVLHAFDAEQPGLMTIAASIDDGLLTLRFSDNGGGMPERIATRAFEPFFTTRRGSGGSGLGLHVVFNLVTQMLGGRIELLTAPGQGCVFVMRLPLIAPERRVGRE